MNGAKYSFPRRFGILFALLAISGACGYLLLQHFASNPEETRIDPDIQKGRKIADTSASPDSIHSDNVSGESSDIIGEASAGADYSSNWEHPAWPGSPVLETLESEPGQSGVFRRVTVVRPHDLSYPVRIEEKMRRDPVTQREEILRHLEMVADRVLVKLHSGHTREELDSAVSGFGGRLLTRVGDGDLFLVQLPDADVKSVPEALDALMADGLLIEYVEPDYVYHAFITPDDSLFDSQWNHNNTGQDGGLVDTDIDAPEGWDILNDASGVIVAINDTGVLYTHEDLAGNMWVNPGEIPADGIDNDGNGIIDDIHGLNAIDNTGNPLDDNGHGTHVAGIIGAIGNNGIGVAGVAWNVQLMALKFLSASGSGTLSDIIRCIDYARVNGADIMNNSWGGGGFSNSLRDAIVRARDAGIIFVAAAGNEANDNDVNPSYPASYDLGNILSVASLTRRNALSSFTNFGSSTVDLAAPGSDILSTYNDSDSSYIALSGTSMATPNISGILALLKAHFPGVNYLSLIDRILAGADSITDMKGTSVTGGRANLQRSLSLDEVQEFPRIVQGLSDRGAILGDSVAFSVIATGGEPLAYNWTKDDQVLPGENSATLNLTEISAEQAGIYEVTVSNSAGSTSNRASLFIGAPSTALREALDDPSINWITLGNAEWTAQTLITSDGVDAGVSGAIGNLQKSRLQTTVTGPGVISFFWKVSSERFFDFLDFYIDGKLQNFIHGETPWAPQTYEVGAGIHILEWIYDKDLFLALGNDAGYLDRFLFEADSFTPPTITRNPESVVILAGADVTFSVEAEGSQPLSYQWGKNGTPIGGATQSTLVLTNVGVSDEGDYTVTVSNVAGTATSAAARLTVSTIIDPPLIVIQPQDLIAITGSTAALTVVVEGTTPLLYSWFKDSQILKDTNASSLVFDNVGQQDEGDYLVFIRNSAGSVISATASLSVVEALIAPIITRQPQSLDVVQGITATFTVVAGGNPPLSYQWFKDGAAISDQINSSLTITSAQPGDAGVYTVTITNPFGSTASAPAFLTVEASSSSISEALDNFEQAWSTTGNALWFFQNAVSRDGEDALQSGALTGLQSSAIHTTIIGAGQISFYWKVSSEQNLDLLNFYINDILMDSISGILDWRLATFEVSEGINDLRWEYQKNLSQSAGQDAGWVDLVEFVPFDTEKPRFTIHPQDRIGIEGGAASFTVEVVGENPISLQWQKDGIDLPGATSAVLELDGLVPEDAGEYRVVASNGFGSTTGRAGVLSVFQSLFTFPDALDNESFTWDVAGDAPWFGQSEVTIDGSDALQSGSVGNLQISTFSTTVKGPMTLSFWWKVSSEEDFDFLQLRMDSVLLGEISGERAWRQILLTVPEGDRKLEWSYVKDSAMSAGQDAGWIDRVKIISANGSPLIFDQPESLTIAEGENAILTVEAIGSDFLTYDWFIGQSGDTSDFQINPLKGTFSTNVLSESASYWVRVSNSFGFVDSHTVTVTVDPQTPRSSDAVIVGGSGSVLGLNVVHPIGNVYDQILMAGQSVAVQADPDQITRVTFLDENDDIVIAEFAGSGTLTITLDPATFEPPAPPVNYNQPNVNYVKGRASFQIFGATRDTWFSVFSLGELNIPFQNSSIFPASIIKNNVTSDGIADVSFLEFRETTEMGGILAGNALFTAEDQFVGIIASDVNVVHLVAIGDIDARDDAIPLIIFHSESEFGQLVITGGDMRQTNDYPVFLSVIGSAPGFQSIKTQDGIRSSGTLVPERPIEARFQNGLQEIDIPLDQ